MRTCITLVSYVELQQKYLNYAGFQGNLNVTVRFAHPSAWDVRDYESRASLIGALRKLNDCRSIELYVMDYSDIMDEVKNDGLERPEKNRKIRSNTDKRCKFQSTDGRKNKCRSHLNKENRLM